MTASNDSAELEALFDSISADISVPTPPVAAVAAPAAGDSDELQALFDSVSATAGLAVTQTPVQISASSGGDADADWPRQEVVFNRIGHMARALHDTLNQLGYDKLIEKTVTALPDAKDRLAYVANLTEQAACRVLNATDVAVPLIDQLESESRGLGERWDKVFANQLSVTEFKALAEETRAFLKDGVTGKTRATHAQLTEIMMAQDFQDLTGQVIKKIVSLAQELESGLMGVLIDVMPETRRTEELNSLVNGPVISAEGRTDVVVNQAQVDDLLESLGF